MLNLKHVLQRRCISLNDLHLLAYTGNTLTFFVYVIQVVLQRRCISLNKWTKYTTILYKIQVVLQRKCISLNLHLRLLT